MKRFSFLSLFLIASTAELSSEETRFGLLKVYAGLYDSSSAFDYQEVRRKSANNLRNGVVIPDETVIECKKDARFSVAFHIVPNQLSYVSFNKSWFYPHFVDEHGLHQRTDPVVYRRPPESKLGIQFVGWRLKKEDLVDGDISLFLHVDEGVLLRHTFQIRGCDSAD